jgi:hypothetical protein
MMNSFERVLRQAEAAKRAKLAAPDLQKGKEWYRRPGIWGDIGDCDHRPAEYAALVNSQARHRVEIKPIVVEAAFDLNQLVPALQYGIDMIRAWGLEGVAN